MRTPASIRYFCTAAEWTAMQAHPVISYWAFRGWRYLKALEGVPVCAVNSLRTAGIDLGNQLSPWYELRDMFSGPVAEQYVNVVCGFNGDVHRLYTVGVPNVAITGPRTGYQVVEPKPDEIESLKKYHLVLTPTEDDVDALRAYGVPATYCPPDLLLPTLRKVLP